ncbi:MAG: Crp/Fnr family transcriptional regulator [Bacteroidia bacterium]|nr:Crp/Fnr family transcriptional regulator [Bacteroidia bacterium]
MTDYFFENLSKIININDEEKIVFKENFSLKKLKRRQFFLHEGNIAYHTGFVNQGCLKTYTIDNNGNEIIYQISIEGWWVADMFSFLTGEAAAYNIEAIEESEVLIMDMSGRDKIFNKVPQFERYMRILLEKNYIANQQRLNSIMSNTAEVRYRNYIKKYPLIANRVPLKTIASYLGIAPESLSRIRKKSNNY